MRRTTRKWVAPIVCCAVLGTQVGCATYTAVKIPGPIHDEDIATGMHRSEVETLIAVDPASQYDDNGGRTVRYAYSDGPHQGSKGRVLVYLAGDVFTLFLSELVFWPIEAYAANQCKRIGTAHFDSNNILTAWTVTRLNGEKVIDISAAPATSSEAAASVPIGETSEGTEAVAGTDKLEAEAPPDSVEKGDEIAEHEPSRESGGEPPLPEVSTGKAKGEPEGATE